MIVGDLLLVMNGDPYFGPPIPRSTCHAIFSVQVSNTVGVGTVQLSVVIEHRNRDDTGWSTAGTFALIGTNGTFSLDLSGLKELVRYSFVFPAGAKSDGMYVFAANPQWLRD